jgi:hypothetical protein
MTQIPTNPSPEKGGSMPDLNRLEEIIAHAQKAHREGVTRKRREIFGFLAPAIPNTKDRLTPFLHEEAMEMDWRGVFKKEWTEDEVLTLQWMRSLWDEKMYVKPQDINGLFPGKRELRMAIFFAIGAANYTSFMIDDFYVKEHSRGHPAPTLLA